MPRGRILSFIYGYKNATWLAVFWWQHPKRTRRTAFVKLGKPYFRNVFGIFFFVSISVFCFLGFFKRFCLCIFRGEGREKER